MNLDKSIKITILGCGPSGGVPLVGGIWGKCDPADPKNYRTRTSILIQTNDHNILVDTSPDLRAQLLRENIGKIDGIFYTHAHADHCHGIDDLRPIFIANKKGPIPVYGEENVIDSLVKMFGYLFIKRGTSDKSVQYPQVLSPNVLPLYHQVNLFGLQWTLFEQDHGFSKTTGYRFGNVAYSTDVKALDDRAFEHLHDLDLWIVSCLGEKLKPTHSHLDLALEWIKRANPKRAILIHMDQSLDYAILKAKLPANVEPAYDGMAVFC